MFSVKPYSAQPKAQSAAKKSEERQDMDTGSAHVGPSKMDFSIYFNLPADYTGGRDEKGELNIPKTKINEALQEVFSNPEISYKIIQPKTELGFYRNAFRAIITMPLSDSPPSDLDVLSNNSNL
mmetsp:Transcript_38060/g.92508  ORF Transcript_38060/g.92508 Transcript_38060/m.92508 type:complete len:124 (-) Transcript_38060:27-398(-)